MYKDPGSILPRVMVGSLSLVIIVGLLGIYNAIVLTLEGTSSPGIMMVMSKPILDIQTTLLMNFFVTDHLL